MASESHREDRRTRLREFLVAQVDLFNKTAADHQWPWEVRRWHELAFCLLTAAAGHALEAERARELTFILADLGLLDVPTLACAARGSGSADATRAFETAVYLLEREGLQPELARRVIAVVADAALEVQSRYEGQVQRYLREYGQQMLDEMDERLPLERLTRTERQLAFTLWLQNVLNMPLSVANPAVLKVCRDFEVSMQDLQQVADELGLNLALLDDVLAEGAGVARPD